MREDRYVYLLWSGQGELTAEVPERYLTVAWDSGANPVVLLNKADLSTTLQDQVAEVEAVAYGVPIHVVSAHTGQGLEALQPYLLPGQTVALIGSSGVGKSSLVNSLLGAAKLKVGAVRASDSDGRHTTTAREMVLLPSGAMLIDSPGMRGLQLWGEEEHLGSSFADVGALAAQCRFHDCRHDAEPGCAVRQALAQGALNAGRYKSYLKLRKELQFLATRTDERARMEARTRSKRQSQWSKTRQKAGGKHG